MPVAFMKACCRDDQTIFSLFNGHETLPQSAFKGFFVAATTAAASSAPSLSAASPMGDLQPGRMPSNTGKSILHQDHRNGMSRSKSYAGLSVRERRTSKQRNKKVSFADSFGLSLVQVQLFDDVGYQRSISLSPSTDRISIQAPWSDKIATPMFRQPGALPNFLELVRSNKVYLENAYADSDNFSIRGIVRVLNMDYHKWSVDDWQTMGEYPATHIDGASNDSATDRFQFRIYSPLNLGQTLVFAVRFHCLGQQFWDSNGGANYRFVCVESEKPETELYAG